MRDFLLTSKTSNALRFGPQEKAKRHAKQEAEQAYDQQYGGY